MSLPNTYTRLTYIESSGTQYIRTGITTDQFNRADFSADVSVALTTNYSAIFGNKTNSSVHSNIFCGYKNNVNEYFSLFTNYAWYHGNSYGSNVDGYITYENGQQIILNVNGEDYNTSLTPLKNNTEIILFGAYNEDGLFWNNPMRIKSISFKNNNTLVRDFIPAKRNSDSVLGLYDLVNDVFYTNAGSGTFIGGTGIKTSVNPEGSGSVDISTSADKFVITATPNPTYSFTNWLLKGYTQLEYIESSGTQYIDSDMNFPNGFRIETKIKLNSNFTQGLNGIVGAHNSSSPYGRNTLAILYHDSYGYKYRFALGQDETTGDIYTEIPASSVSSDTEYDIIAQNFNGNSVLKFGSLVDISSTNSWTRTSNNLYIFAQNNDGTAYAFIKCKLIGYMKIYSQSNTLVRDFIPVIRHSDGAIGLLDKVNMKFYGNSGTGTFIGGPIKEVA